MRARYYSPEMKRFINADIIPGSISQAVTLNRFAFANGNPVSFVDPFGLSAERGITVYYGDIWEGQEHKDMRCGDLVRGQLIDLKWITWYDVLSCTESDFLWSLCDLADFASLTNPAMKSVLFDMIAHFTNGFGEDYSNEILTNEVKIHPSTNKYMQDFSNVFVSFINQNNGDISSFANSEDFKEALRKNNVFFSSYSYEGVEDILGGLTLAIHGWTESQVDLTSFEINSDNTFSGNLRFTFYDNFGLDEEDLEEYGYIGGFKSWFILQHNHCYGEKYKPFRTIANIDFPITGDLKGAS